MRRAPTKRFLFHLALKLGWWNPYALARAMPAKLLMEWMMYAAIEPFDEMRADYRSAQVTQMLYNIHRDAKKDPDGKPLSDFLLKFDDPETPEEKREKAVKALENKMRVMEITMRAQALAAAESRQPLPRVHEHSYPQVDAIVEQVVPVLDDDRVQRALAAARAAMKEA